MPTPRIRLFFSKSYNIPDGTFEAEHIDVQATGLAGQTLYSKDGHYRGTPRDYKNSHNMLSQIEVLLATAVNRFNWPKDMSLKSVIDAIQKYVDPKHEYDIIDKKIAKDISQAADRSQDIADLNEYRYVIQQLRNEKNPETLKNVLTGKNTISTKIHNFFVGPHFISKDLTKLTPHYKKQLLAFVRQHDFAPSVQIINAEISRIDQIIQDSFRSHKTSVQYDSAVECCINALLVDALYNEYYKRTGDNSIFFSPLRKKEMQFASDADLISQHGKFASQYYQDAIMINERIKTKDLETLPEFLANLEPVSSYYWNYFNQDILKMYVDTIHDKGVNKYKMPAAVKKFLERLGYFSKNPAVTKKINQMLGKKMTRDQMDAAKGIIKARLSKRAKELQNGKTVAGAIVANEMADEIIRARNMGFDITITPDTASKFRSAKHKLNKNQKLVIEFAERKPKNRYTR